MARAAATAIITTAATSQGRLACRFELLSIEVAVGEIVGCSVADGEGVGDGDVVGEGVGDQVRD